jgi:molybdopterin molybdotransferase
VRILSGAPVPKGADAVVAEEFTQRFGDTIRVINDAHPGRNILPQGSDVRRGELLVHKGVRLAPPTVGLLAAAGYQSLPVVRQLKVAILATGDEVVAPGEPLQPGKLYASNLVTLAAWCVRYGYAVETFVVRDDADLIRKKLVTCLQDYDVVLTSGGAWSGERDLVVRILDELGWHKIYHRVRIGPGKAVAFGLFAEKPVFCLPGGPPSNHMAFLQLALPGLQKKAGEQDVGLPVQKMRLAKAISGQVDWTQCVHGRLEETTDIPLFHPLNPPSRLQMMSAADAIVKIPEGQSTIPQGQMVEGQVLR